MWNWCVGRSYWQQLSFTVESPPVSFDFSRVKKTIERLMPCRWRTQSGPKCKSKPPTEGRDWQSCVGELIRAIWICQRGETNRLTTTDGGWERPNSGRIHDWIPSNNGDWSVGLAATTWERHSPIGNRFPHGFMSFFRLISGVKVAQMSSKSGKLPKTVATKDATK